jgi:hypothetical protein
MLTFSIKKKMYQEKFLKLCSLVYKDVDLSKLKHLYTNILERDFSHTKIFLFEHMEY